MKMAKLHCRIGSSEKLSTLKGADRDLHCRIGSSENDVKEGVAA